MPILIFKFKTMAKKIKKYKNGKHGYGIYSDAELGLTEHPPEAYKEVKETETCATCQGSGERMVNGRPVKCPDCEGSGEAIYFKLILLGLAVLIAIILL